MATRPKYRKAPDYRRRAPTREPYDVVLIVCEGQKTEPLYLKRLCAAHRLSSANIEVLSSPGTDPMSIVTFAESRVHDDYDRIYCVFDRNGHQTYDAAMRRIRELSMNNPRRISAIVSWPCFELWLLLHFTYSSRPFDRTPRASACELVVTELRHHLPRYQKGLNSLYDELHSRQTTAMSHAARLATENDGTGTQNPSTTMHELVSYLLNLRAD